MGSHHFRSEFRAAVGQTTQACNGVLTCSGYLSSPRDEYTGRYGLSPRKKPR